jgi:signal transduction histidine kinase
MKSEGKRLYYEQKEAIDKSIREIVNRFYNALSFKDKSGITFDRLAQTGELINTNQLYLFDFNDFHPQHVNITHHWSNPLKDHEQPNITKVPLHLLTKWRQALEQGKTVYRHHIAIRDRFDTKGHAPSVTVSFILIPIIVHNNLSSVFCIEHSLDKRWTEIILPAATVAASIIIFVRETRSYYYGEQADTPGSFLSRHPNLFLHKSRIESLGILTAGIAHEINQPITAISMSIENILIRLNDESIDKNYISEKCRNIGIHIQRINNIINHIRFFSKEHRSVNLEIIDVNKVITETLSLFRSQSINQNITVTTELAPDAGHIFWDSVEFEQILINLFSNARDAVNQKEKTIQDPSYTKKIVIKTTRNDKNILLQMSDNGIGIPEENFSRLFEPFFTTKDDDNGTGLGLSIIQALVNEMKGEIAIESKVNEFTTVKILLPHIDPMKK